VHPPVCRVTVQGPGRRLDLVIPSGVPLVELLPGLVELGTGGARSSEQVGGSVEAWSLTRPLGPDLSPTVTLREASVRDGDLLLLRHHTAPPLGVLRSDPVVGLADAVDRLPGDWTAHRRAALALGLLGPLLAALLTVLAVVAGPGAAGAGAALVAALLVAAALPSAARDEPVAAALAALAALPGAFAGRAVAAGLGSGPVGTAAFVAAGVVLGAVVALLVRPARAVAAGIGAAALLGLLVAFLALASTSVRAGALGGVAALALLPLVPPAALRVAGLLEASGGARGDAPERARTARIAVVSLTAGLGALVVLLGSVAGLGGGASGRWLAAGLGVALLLRSRAARRTGEVLALALTGLAALAGAAVACTLRALADGSDALAVLPAAALVLGLLVAALPAARPGLGAPSADRLSRRLEGFALVALVPLALAVCGVLGVVADAASGLR